MSYSGGSGGAGRIATSSDVALNNPTTGQVLAYDGTLQKWQNTIVASSASALSAKVASPVTWAASTAYAVGDYVVNSTTSVIFRVVVAHTSGSTAPLVSDARPTNSSSNYEVWASPGNSPGSLLRRSSTNEVTVDMMYVLDEPQYDTSAANKLYVDTAVANVTVSNRPAMSLPVIYVAGVWKYKNATITARPSDLQVGDVIMFIGNPGGSLPAWAAENDVWISG